EASRPREHTRSLEKYRRNWRCSLQTATGQKRGIPPQNCRTRRTFHDTPNSPRSNPIPPFYSDVTPGENRIRLIHQSSRQGGEVRGVYRSALGEIKKKPWKSRISSTFLSDSSDRAV